MIRVSYPSAFVYHDASECQIPGFTTERLPPDEDHTLPERFSLGLVSYFILLGSNYTTFMFTMLLR
jgi:hypothetical protein